MHKVLSELVNPVVRVIEGDRKPALAGIADRVMRDATDYQSALRVLDAVNLTTCDPPLGPLDVAQIGLSAWEKRGNTFFKAAEEYDALGFKLVVVEPDAKTPRYRCDSLAQFKELWRDGCNIGVILGKAAVLNVDRKSGAWSKNPETYADGAMCPLTKTPNGFHFWLDGETVSPCRCERGALTTGLSYVVVPPSVVGGVRYEWIRNLDTTRPSLSSFLTCIANLL